MPNVICCVPGCSNRSDRETDRSYHCLPLKDKPILRAWIHKIGRSNLSLKSNTRVCSDHFVNSCGRKLRPNEVPTQNLPKLTTSKASPKKRKLPAPRSPNEGEQSVEDDAITSVPSISTTLETGTQVGSSYMQLADVSTSTSAIERPMQPNRMGVDAIKDNPDMFQYYTGFPTYKVFLAFYSYLGPAVDSLIYSEKSAEKPRTTFSALKTGRIRALQPVDELLLVLMRLHLGLFEQDLAYRFAVSQPTVSRVWSTWINFLYHKLKDLPLWMSRDSVQATMPTMFKMDYSTTRIIIDATEMYIEKPSMPEIQQLTFSRYKNHNTYKGLVGISPSGVVTFVSDLFPGSISDQEIVRRSGLLRLLEVGDSIMADRGFDIEDDIAPLGVRVNIPPFLKGKQQFDSKDLIITRRIASLRIHVERCMERIKNFHIFDRILPSSFHKTSTQMFFVCAVLTNFCYPPLCA